MAAAEQRGAGGGSISHCNVPTGSCAGLLSSDRNRDQAADLAGELADRGAAHQLHVALDLRLQQAEGPLDTRMAGRRQRIR